MTVTGSRKKKAGRATSKPAKIAKKEKAPLTHAQRVRSICGKHAFVDFSGDDHVREKPREAALEDHHLGPMTEEERRRGLRELRGKYADAFPSVAKYLRMKRAEVKAGRL